MDEVKLSIEPAAVEEPNYSLSQTWLSRFPILLLGFFVYYLSEFGNLLRENLKPFWGIFYIFILSGIWLFTKNWPSYRLNDRIPIILLIVLFLTYPYIHDWWWWTYYGGGAAPTNSDYQEVLDLSLILLIVLIFSYALEDKELGRFGKIRFILILGVLFRIKFYTILSFPNPIIDVWDALTLGPANLLEGKNPYTQSYPPNTFHSGETFFYPPGLLLFFTPIRIIDQDARYMLLIIEFMIALLIYIKAGKNTNGELLSLTLLVLPFSYFFLHYGWTEPILVFVLAILIFWGDKPDALKWRPFVFGILATLKQPMWLLMPFYAVYLLLRRKQGIKEGMLSLVPFLIIMLPFYLMSPEDLIQDIWRFHTVQVRYESLTINSYFQRESIRQLSINSFLLPYFSFLILYGITSWKNPNTAYINLFKFAFYSIFLFFLWGVVAFMNHYYLIIGGFYLLMIKQACEYNESIKINTSTPIKNTPSSIEGNSDMIAE
ncbi:MAG: hypothetical protein ACW99A_07310 [Candidatus Kariarchaeaceae archaeon]|jgi:hypothetical protein